MLKFIPLISIVIALIVAAIIRSSAVRNSGASIFLIGVVCGIGLGIAVGIVVARQYRLTK